jgi:GDP-L-fucose synthase
VAKIAGIEMCWSFNRQYGTRYLAAMPTNLYGPEDNYDLANSHVLPALMRKVAEAKASNQDKIVVWGSGTPRREFLHSDDLAEACVFLMNLGDSKFDGLLSKEAAPLVNIGAGVDLTIRELAQKICQVFEFNGELEFDSSKPDGTLRKLMDSSLINGLGWRAKITLEEGIRRIYEQKFVAQRV